ncbi:MAG: DUF2334 domain-containing protein [Thaumarchaeota archaeon]|nr:DUF2334 domain-containing protein [Nitrososphaerota archaeon]
MKRREVLKLGVTGALAFAAGLYVRSVISAKPEKIKGKYFVEVHDLAPWVYQAGYLQKMNDYLDNIGINRRDYFLIPSNKDDKEILEHNPGFIGYVKRKILGRYPIGHHGLLHWPIDEENGVYEFTYANKEQTRKKCEEAVRIHEKVFGRPPDGGEVPPNWSYSPEALETFLEYYPYVSIYDFVLIRDGPPIFAQAYLPTSGIEDPEKSAKMFLQEIDYYKPDVVRIVIHPQDTKSEYFEEVAERVINIVEGRGYELSTYERELGGGGKTLSQQIT